MTIPFRKMHGLGNDFVVIDGREAPIPLTVDAVRAIADRRTGVGFDELMLIEPARSPGTDAFLRIYNADGSQSGACGNGTRCVAALVMSETGRREAVIETIAGKLQAEAQRNGMISVDMGQAKLEWDDIPLSRPQDTLHLDLSLGPLSAPVAVNIGNPHAVFFVPDAEAVPLGELGARLEHDPLFPERANIEVAQILGPARIRMRVWERGAGVTRACGSGACATLVAAVRRGLSERKAELVLDGGSLWIEWREDGHVIMTGPVATSFSGVLSPELLALPERAYA
jgi:diaminopimelate epimerase